jgi:ketosteroid isomerase-like protein
MASPSAAPWPDHPNVALVKRACIAARKGDRSVVEELFAEDAELYVPGNNLLAGYYEGREGILAFYSKARELSGGTLRAYLHDVVANGHHAFAIENFMASRGGRNLDSRDVTVFHVVDGKIGGGTRLFTEIQVHDEFWS